MTTEHPITPPPELVQKWEQAWYSESWDGDLADLIEEIWRESSDRELEACCEYMQHEDFHGFAKELRAARRPKAASLKAQALAVIENSEICDHLSPEHAAILRRALEALDD